MKVRASLIELWKKFTPYKETDKIYYNGENNMYSEEMELTVNNSPTGARAKEMYSKFCFGKGLSETKDVEFSNGVLLSEIAKDIIDDVVVQNGAFIHTTYRIDLDGDSVVFKPHQPKSLDYNKCRISAEDDEGNEGMILYKNYNKLDRSITKKEKDYSKKYYPFNPDNNVVKAQINTDAKEAGYAGDEWSEKIKHYRGQVMYLNLTPKFRYAISKFDSVYNDLDTEYRVSVYFNGNTRNGFLGKTMILTQGLDEEDGIDIDADIAEWIGPDGSSGIYHLSVDQVDELDKVVKVIQVASQFDDKQFNLLMPNLKSNILGAANNLPEDLAVSSSGMFDSGEKYEQLKAFYWEQCEWERQKIQDAFNKLGHDFHFMYFNEEDVVVNENEIDEVEASPEASDETLQAQAALRGSVGGVQGILGVQASVSSGSTDYESAITILMEIYGFNRTVSESLLGKPKEETDVN